MHHLLQLFCFLFLAGGAFAQVTRDTVQQNGKRGKATIQVIPCPCDSNNMDSFVMMPIEFYDFQKTISTCTVFRYSQAVFCLKSVETTCWPNVLNNFSGSESGRDTLLESGRKGRSIRLIVPVVCDSIKMVFICPLKSISGDINQISRDTIIPFYRFKYCLDTFETIEWQKSILDIADSLALVMNVPKQLVYEIGINESKWPRVYDLTYLIVFGDLQVIDRTFNYFYKQLMLKGGKTRINYLIVGIYYLRLNYEQLGSWKKARYAYGRGFWKPPNQWTPLEKKFMNRIDWAKYD